MQDVSKRIGGLSSYLECLETFDWGLFNSLEKGLEHYSIFFRDTL